MREIVVEAVVALSPVDISGWIHALEALVSEPQRRKQLRQAATSRAARFDWEKSSAQVANLYKLASG